MRGTYKKLRKPFTAFLLWHKQKTKRKKKKKIFHFGGILSSLHLFWFSTNLCHDSSVMTRDQPHCVNYTKFDLLLEMFSHRQWRLKCECGVTLNKHQGKIKVTTCFVAPSLAKTWSVFIKPLVAKPITYSSLMHFSRLWTKMCIWLWVIL